MIGPRWRIRHLPGIKKSLLFKLCICHLPLSYSIYPLYVLTNELLPKYRGLLLAAKEIVCLKLKDISVYKLVAKNAEV